MKRDITKALRARLSRMTAERDMFKGMAAKSLQRIACLELLLNAVLGRKRKGRP